MVRRTVRPHCAVHPHHPHGRDESRRAVICAALRRGTVHLNQHSAAFLQAEPGLFLLFCLTIVSDYLIFRRSAHLSIFFIQEGRSNNLITRRSAAHRMSSSISFRRLRPKHGENYTTNRALFATAPPTPWNEPRNTRRSRKWGAVIFSRKGRKSRRGSVFSRRGRRGRRGVGG